MVISCGQEGVSPFLMLSAWVGIVLAAQCERTGRRARESLRQRERASAGVRAQWIGVWITPTCGELGVADGVAHVDLVGEDGRLSSGFGGRFRPFSPDFVFQRF